MTDIRFYAEKVARGLQKMEKKPDAFLFAKDDGDVWDEPTILGIPVFHTVFVDNVMTDDEIPFIPLWRSDGDYIIDRKRFNDGFSA
jgi:hypothetical protein